MGRILAIDYGVKRTGLAVSDPMRIIATALEVVETTGLMQFLTSYFKKETVDEIVVGMPKRLNNEDSETAPRVRKFVEQFSIAFPDKPVFLADERFTSAIAQRAMIDGGMRKSQRQIKGNVDKVSATLILQNYMEMKK